MGEDLADVVAAGAEDGKDGVADAARQRAPGEPPIRLHVPDLRLDGLRRLRSFARSGVMPRLVPLIRTRVVSTP